MLFLKLTPGLEEGGRKAEKGKDARAEASFKEAQGGTH